MIHRLACLLPLGLFAACGPGTPNDPIDEADTTELCADCVPIQVVAEPDGEGDGCGLPEDTGPTSDTGMPSVTSSCDWAFEAKAFTEWEPLRNLLAIIPISARTDDPDLEAHLDLAHHTALVAWEKSPKRGFRLAPRRAVTVDGIIEVEWEKFSPNGETFDAFGTAWVIAVVEGHGHTFRHTLTVTPPSD